MKVEICTNAISAPKCRTTGIGQMARGINARASGKGRGISTMCWKVAAVALAVALSGCSTTDVAGQGPSAQAFAQSRSERPVSASIVDAMAGGLIGGTLGANLDTGERRRALEAEYRALEYTPAGQAVAWGRSGAARSGEVVAGSPYRVGSQNCRQYTHTVQTGGRSQVARGTACRNADGSWTPLA